MLVGDDDGGGGPAEPGDDQLADGAWVAGQFDGGVFVDLRPVVGGSARSKVMVVSSAG
ncbi:MAG: hypothetical protein M0005_02655 [Actinomycetota bacterium]|nr:hypothetical protein [Actinomycetota bacterium]